MRPSLNFDKSIFVTVGHSKPSQSRIFRLESQNPQDLAIQGRMFTGQGRGEASTSLLLF